MQHVEEGSDPFTATENHFYMPRHSNQRFLVQKGLFTSHNEPSKILENDTLKRIILSDDCLAELRTTLRVYGFSTGTLFPGLDGLCVDITERWFRPRKGPESA